VSDDFDFSWLFILALAVALLIGLPLLLGGCAPAGVKRHERARVVALPYVPPALPLHSVNPASEAPAAYGVVLACQHGLFTLSGSDSWHEELWKSLREDEWVDVEFYEDERGVLLRTTSVEPALDSRGNCAFHPQIDSPAAKHCEDCFTVDKRAVTL
jgi:hypothetical protein